jgi:hypothetical protein|tara:strand:+ start:247 stop:390 length:144 start_codon:yes stop_codon:yes gene_type:complete
MAFKLKNQAAFKKLSDSCKAWGKRTYKKWPSAYASGGALQAQKRGDC